MAAIAALTDPFDGTNNTTASTSNTGADSITGTAALATFTTTAGEFQKGTSALEVAATGTADSVILRYDFTADASIYLDFYIQVATLPSASVAVLNWYSSTTKVGDLRIVPGSGVFQFQLRDVSSAKTTTATLPTGWYRVAIKINPNSATGHQLRVFNGAGIDSTTPTIDGGPVTANGSAATTVDNIRLGFISSVTGVIRIDDLQADDTDWVVRPPGGGGGGAIASLDEDFEGGTGGNAVTTGTTIFDTLSGTAGTFHSSNPYADTLCMKVATSSASSIQRADFTADDDVWFKCAFKYVTLPAGNTAIMGVYDGTTKVCDVQVTTAGELRLRDNVTTRWTSTALTANEWHEVALKVKSTATAALALRIYSGPGRGTATATQDSTDQTFSASTGSISNWRVGLLSSDTGEVHFDVLRADNTVEPDGITPSVTPITAKHRQSSAWTSATATKHRKAGAWV